LKEERSERSEELAETGGYITLSRAQPPSHSSARPAGPGSEVSHLKAQLREAEERAQEVQREVRPSCSQRIHVIVLMTCLFSRLFCVSVSVRG